VGSLLFPFPPPLPSSTLLFSIVGAAFLNVSFLHVPTFSVVDGSFFVFFLGDEPPSAVMLSYSDNLLADLGNQWRDERKESVVTKLAVE